MAIWTPLSKIVSGWTTDNRVGKSWLYNESDLTYDMPTLTYNLIGNAITWTTITETIKSFLLKEDGYYLLLEDGGKIILEPQSGVNWINEIKH